MDAIFMNSKNIKASESHIVLLNLEDKINLKKKDQYVALLNPSMYYTWKNIENSNENNRFKLSSATWSEKLGPFDG